MYKVNSWGKEYDVTLGAQKYADGGLAVTMEYMDDEFKCMMPFAKLTVNLGCRLNYGYAYVDTNNCPWAEEFIEKYGLGKFTGKVCRSGFCEYPLYKFNMEKIAE